jgi:hypothetical protein
MPVHLARPRGELSADDGGICIGRICPATPCAIYQYLVGRVEPQAGEWDAGRRRHCLDRIAIRRACEHRVNDHRVSGLEECCRTLKRRLVHAARHVSGIPRGTQARETTYTTKLFTNLIAADHQGAWRRPYCRRSRRSRCRA